MERRRRKLRVEVAPESIIKNITNFFSNERACIPEYLQNCRRAEASEVTIEVNVPERTLTFRDNGHGVFDPKSLITIGKSDWATKTEAEMPAGMGLFSGFKLGNRLTVRSGDWSLDLDFTRKLEVDAVMLHEGLEKVRGTEVKLYLNNDRAINVLRCSSTQGEVLAKYDELVDQLRRHLAGDVIFMPFETTIEIVHQPKVAAWKVPAFNPHNKDLGLICHKDYSWGSCFVYEGSKIDKYYATYVPKAYDPSVGRNFLTCQGLYFDLSSFGLTERSRHTAATKGDVVNMVLIKSGQLDFSLPDRDKILLNEKHERIAADVLEGFRKTWLDAIDIVHTRPTRDDETKHALITSLVSNFADKFDDKRDQLPHDYQYLRVNEYGTFVWREHVDKVIKNGGIFVARPGRHRRNDVAAIMNLLDEREHYRNNPKTTMLHSISAGMFKQEKEWAAKFFPKARFADGYLVHVSDDSRADGLAHVHRVDVFAIEKDQRVVLTELTLESHQMIYENDLDTDDDYSIDALIADDGKATDELAWYANAGSVLVVNANPDGQNLVASGECILHTYGDAEILDDIPHFHEDDRDHFAFDREDYNGERENWYEHELYFAIVNTRKDFQFTHNDVDALVAYLNHHFKPLRFDCFENAKVSFSRGVTFHHGTIVFMETFYKETRTVRGVEVPSGAVAKFTINSDGEIVKREVKKQ